jgi:hypothetical protein
VGVLQVGTFLNFVAVAYYRMCSLTIECVLLQVGTFLNFVAVAYNSSTALPFGTVVVILLILTLIRSNPAALSTP